MVFEEKKKFSSTKKIWKNFFFPNFRRGSEQKKRWIWLLQKILAAEPLCFWLKQSNSSFFNVPGEPLCFAGKKKSLSRKKFFFPNFPKGSEQKKDEFDCFSQKHRGSTAKIFWSSQIHLFLMYRANPYVLGSWPCEKKNFEKFFLFLFSKKKFFFSSNQRLTTER